MADAPLTTAPLTDAPLAAAPLMAAPLAAAPAMAGQLGAGPLMADRVPRVLIAVRTHKADAASLAAFNLYAGVTGATTVFALDERGGPVDTGGRAKAAYTAAWLEKSGLFPHPDCGWRCGDYNYYTLREAFPAYDQYWLIEPDVLINFADINAFFSAFADDTADYLCGRFGPRLAHWDWYAAVAPDYPAVYGGVFPITRASGRAIDHLFQERRRLSSLVGTAKPVRWANDEAFVASCLMAAGFSCRDLNTAGRVVRSEASLRTGVVHDSAALAAQPPDGLVYHPVRKLADVLAKTELGLKRFHRMAPGAVLSREEALLLIRTARTCLDNPAYADGAIVPLTLIRELSAPRTGDDAAPPAGTPPPTAVQATNLYRRFFAPAAGAAPVGQVHAVRPVKPAGPYSTAAARDMQLGKPLPLARLPKRFALPFAFDFEAKTLLHTLHMQPRLLLEQPFFYIAQRERSHAVAAIPWANLVTAHGAPDSAAAPVFLFSIGRTGSTLLGKMIGCTTPRAFLEPDTLTQLAANRALLQALPPEQSRQLIWSAVAPFFDTQLGEGVDGRCVIKLRSQVNALAGDIAAVFPAARYVFMLRARRAWGRSTFRAFRISTEAAVGRLLAGLQALQDLRDAGVQVEVVTYEDVVADPPAAIARIMGPEVARDAAVLAKLATTMAQDSQAEASIARENTARAADGEDSWLAEFDLRWADKKPVSLLAQLGLDMP